MNKSPLVLIVMLLAMVMLSFASTSQGYPMGQPDARSDEPEDETEDKTDDDDEEQMRLKAQVCEKFQDIEWFGTDPTDPGHFLYSFRFCENSSEPACNERNGSLCQYDITKNLQFYSSLGSSSSFPSPTYSTYYNDTTSETGYSIRYENGEPCWFGFKTFPRVVVVNLICDDRQSPQGEPVRRIFEVINDICFYTATIRTNLACQPELPGLDNVNPCNGY